MTETSITSQIPKWFWVAAALGLAWNLYGVLQWGMSVTATAESLVASGLTPEQASVMLGYPSWMTVAFAVGVFGGLIGSVTLLLRKKISTAIFAVSLVGYIVLYIGDITEGVFEAMGTIQVVILSTVVAIAAALLWMSRHFEKRGQLT